MIRCASLLVLFFLCLGSVSRAAGESAAEVKGKLESLVRQAAGGPVVRGPSLTWLVTELLDSDPETLRAVLRALAKDVAEGRLVFLDDPPGLFSPPPEPLRRDIHRAHSDVACPIPNMSKAEPDFPVHAGGEWVEEGFRLTLRNTGKKPFLVNPVALRYGIGQVTDVVVTRDGKRKEFRALKLELGFIRAQAAVPIGELVLLPPGQSYTWVQPVRGIDRDVDHIALSIGSIAILGRTTHPLLTGLNDTWIR